MEERQPKPLSIYELPSIHRSIISGDNGYERIEPCYGKPGTNNCPKLDPTGKKLCSLQHELEYVADGIECPIQRGFIKII